MTPLRETDTLATIQDLVCALTGQAPSEFPSAADQAYALGWLWQQDLLFPTAFLERRSIARILHMYLCIVMGEKDEADVTISYHLRDLYDCRVCAGHVMQIYTKGIMDGLEYAKDLLLFGMKEKVTKKELHQIIKRTLDPSMRIKR